jgi:hypothetical protein
LAVVGRCRGTSIDRGSESVLRDVGSDLGVAHQGAGQAMHPIGIVEAEVTGSVGGVHGDELDLSARSDRAGRATAVRTRTGCLARFRAHALNEWLDFAPAFEHAARQFRRRLVEIAPRQG